MAEPIHAPAPEISRLSLDEIMKAIADQRLPPVEKWQPDHCGHSDMRIAADGTWFYSGSPIGRAPLVRLFSSVLRREPDGSHVLVTPVEKLDIAVDDAPFVAVELTSEGKGESRRLAFRLNTDDIVIASPDHPIRVALADDGTPRPYLHVRGRIGNGLEALIARPLFYELAEMALSEQQDERVGIWSGGAFFAFPR